VWSWIPINIFFLLLLTGCGADWGLSEVRPTQTSLMFVTPTTSATIESGTSPGAQVVARVNNSEIVIEQVQQWGLPFQKIRQAEGNNSDPTIEYRTEAQILEKLIQQKIVEQQGDNLGLSVSETEIEAAYVNIKSQFRSDQAFETWLKNNQLDKQQIRDILGSDLLTTKLFEYITQNTPEGDTQIKVSYLWVTEEQAVQQVKDQLAQGQTLAAVGEALTQPQLEDTGYSTLDWFPAGAAFLPDAIEYEVFQAERDEIVGPIDDSGRYYFVQVEGRATQHPLAPDRLSALRQQIFLEWLRQKRAEANIEYFMTLN
jgi:hypothetical protein